MKACRLQPEDRRCGRRGRAASPSILRASSRGMYPASNCQVRARCLQLQLAGRPDHRLVSDPSQDCPTQLNPPQFFLYTEPLIGTSGIVPVVTRLASEKSFVALMRDVWLSEDLRRETRVLLVGAGGIGCEALKNLVLSGFQKFTIVDLDCIDVSNLNRQFLFRKRDVGKSKAQVAAEAARRYFKDGDSRLDISVHTCRVQDIPIEVFSQHDIIMNALDNFEARRFVNRVAVGLEIPIVESGSTGDNGQAFPIWAAAKTECFDCRDQPKAESFPVCTVRLTPEKPQHCVAWARYLLELLFGPSESLEDNALSDMKEKLQASPEESQDSTVFAIELAKKLFVLDIEELLATQEFRGDSIIPPVPLKCIDTSVSNLGEGKYVKNPNSPEARDVWDIETNMKIFLDSAAWLKNRCANRMLKFDKDDDQIMAFVAAAANLRMANYSIKMQSLWECKSIAGSIQPAIAATNAIVAGLQVDQALRLLKAKEDYKENKPTRENLAEYGIRFMWVRHKSTGQYLLAPEQLEPPNPNCFICQQKRIRIVLKNLAEWKVKDFLEKILKESLDCLGDVFLQTASSVVYDPDLAEDDPDLIHRNLKSAGIVSGEMVSLTATGLRNVSFDLIIKESPEAFPNFSAQDFPFEIQRANDIEEGALMNSEAFRKHKAPMEVLEEDEETPENKPFGSEDRKDQMKRRQTEVAPSTDLPSSAALKKRRLTPEDTRIE